MKIVKAIGRLRAELVNISIRCAKKYVTAYDQFHIRRHIVLTFDGALYV